MLTSRNTVIAIAFLFQCASAAPQYFDDRGYPSYQDGVNLGIMQHADYDRWFDANALPNQDSSDFWSTGVSDSLTPPVHAESQFDSIIIEAENQPFDEQYQRGRGDIDPEEDEDGFDGYFYPKPKIPFDLPEFKPVSAGAAAEDVTMTTTTGNGEDATEETTTPETSTVKA